MSSFGQVPLKQVWAMLESCAPGHSVKPYTHSYCIMMPAGGKTYPTFPKKDQIDKGHIKKMARHLGILDCAIKFLSL